MGSLKLSSSHPPLTWPPRSDANQSNPGASSQKRDKEQEEEN